MSMATRTDTPALHAADSHDLIRVHGARENNLKDVSLEIPKRRLTVFTGVSGSGKSSLVFDTIAAESQRMINETYSAFVQGFMPTLARPEVDLLDGLTPAIIVDQERKAAARGENDEKALLAKIAQMPGPDRAMAKRLHELVKASAPTLSPKTWYGMPAYANKDGKVVCFFTPASKFKSRYATFGFNDDANLDEGAMWPTSFALKDLTGAEEAKIAALVKKALS